MKWQYRSEILSVTPPVEMVEWLTELGFPTIFAPALWSRGLHSQASLREFFRPNEAELLSPLRFGEEMSKAVARLRQAFEKREHIVIFGDYDVDGTSGTALIQGVLNRLSGHYGFSSDVMLSDRFTEGYGLNPKNLGRLAGMHPHLVVTVDCGISSGDEIASLKESGIDVIITDHHGLKGEFPAAAVAVVHPGLAVEETLPPVSGCCVAWQLMRGLWEVNGKTSPDWVAQGMLDLVALGAVCDIMPLNVPENRFFVSEGLKKIAAGERTAFRTMGKNNGWRKVSTYMLGYVIGPRINAAGRMNTESGAAPVVEWLLSQDEKRCREIGAQLEQFNTERRREQEEAVRIGILQLEGELPAKYERLSLVQGDFHEGVVGIVASKLAEKFYRPAFVIAATEETGKTGVLRGSARSIPGVNLFNIMERHQGYLVQWGGHAMAAGMSIRENQMTDFFSAVDGELVTLPDSTWEKIRWIDGRLAEADLTDNFFAGIREMEPHGEKFPQFIWSLRGRVTQGRIMDFPGSPKAGILLVGGLSFPFVMWENSPRLEFEKMQTFAGCWEYNDYQRKIQFKALDVLEEE